MKYYGPTHTYRFEVRGFGPVFFTDDHSEAIRVARERSELSKKTVWIVDNDTNCIGVYTPKTRFSALKQ